MGVGPCFNIEIPFDSVKEAKKWLESQNLEIHQDTTEYPYSGGIKFQDQVFDFAFLKEENEYWGNALSPSLNIVYFVDYAEFVDELLPKIKKMSELNKMLGEQDREFNATAYTI